MLRAVVHNGALVTVGGKILTINAINNFIENLSRLGYTFSEALLRNRFESLPIKPTTGISLFPYAYKSGAIAMMSNATGSVIDASFSRSGAGWAIHNSDLVELTLNTPRADDFYYIEDLGYLVEGSNTNKTVSFNFGGSYSLDWPFSNQLPDGHRIEIPGYVRNRETRGGDYPHRFSAFLMREDLEDLQFATINSPLYDIGWASATINPPIKRIENTSIFYVTGIKNSVVTPSNEGFRKYPENTSNAVYASGWMFSENIDNLSFIKGNNVTRPAEILQVPITYTTDIWLKTDQGEQVIEAVPAGDFNVHDYITNGKLIALIAPMRQFTPEERSVLDV